MSTENQDLEKVFANAILKESREKIESIVKEEVEELKNDVTTQVKEIKSKLSKKVQNLENLVNNEPLTVNLGTATKPKNEIVHEKFYTILDILQSAKRINKNIMLVGNCGGGKSVLASQVAKSLNLEFYPMSVGPQTTKSDLIGFINAKGEYMTTPIREAFEKGGLLLLDEFDSTHAGVVTILNSLLANGICSFPDKIIQKHKDFICIVACNTYGRGGSVEYIGRNRLDSATLDRFITINIEYDEKLESKLVNNKSLMSIIKKMRKNIDESGLKMIVSPRASMQIADLLDSCSFDIEQALEMCVFKGCNEDIRSKLLKGIVLANFKSSNSKGTRKATETKEDKKEVVVHMDFNSNTFSVKGIEEDLSICQDVDWNGKFSIHFGVTSSWFPDITPECIYMNQDGVCSFNEMRLNEYGAIIYRELKDNFNTIKNKKYKFLFEVYAKGSKTVENFVVE